LTHMSISTYFRPNIHQNGPEILGVNFVGLVPWLLKNSCMLGDVEHISSQK
jgi:hypothetical protein